MRTPFARALGAVLMLVVLATSRGDAAGTVTVATVRQPAGVTKYTIAWVSTAGGAVSANLFSVTPGELLQAKFVPDGGGTAPTDLYDIVLNDTSGVDVLAGAGANLSGTVSTIKVPSFGTTTLYRYYHDGTQQLDLQVSNAGAAKGGTVYLWVR